MRILFISNYFPGDLGGLARLLAASANNDVLFASNRQRAGFTLPGVRRIRLKSYPPLFGGDKKSASLIWNDVLTRGTGVLPTLQSVSRSWGKPDIVFASMAAGAAFFARQAFPDAYLVTYTESGLKNHSLLSPGMRDAWTLIQATLFMQANLGFAFSEEERRTFPRQIQGDIRLVPPSVDTEIFSRSSAKPWFVETADIGEVPQLLTLNAIGVEGDQLEEIMTIAHAVLKESSHCRICILTENRSRADVLEAMCSLWPANWRQRLFIYHSLPFLRYRDLIAASSLLVSPGYNEGSTRLLLQAMSCETLIMAKAETADFLKPGVNMLEFPIARPEKAVLSTLKSLTALGNSLAFPEAQIARQYIHAHFSEQVVTPIHLAEVLHTWSNG